MAPDLPNIVLIFCDDLGYGDIGCYGSTLTATPRLDRLAREGVRFTDFYVSASVCSPSRASLMTGCYAQRIGLATGDGHPVLFPADSIGLSASELTLPRVLSNAGYVSACIGKWHLGDQREFLPDKHGFDFFYGFPYSNDMHPQHPMNDRHRFPPLPLLRSGSTIPAVAPSAARSLSIEEIEPDQSRLEIRYTELACEFVKENRSRPFFLYFPHMYVHRPLFAPDEFLPSPRPDTFDGYTDTSSEDYSAEVRCLDWSTGRILDTLDEFGLSENTIVIFTSDNGSNTMNGGSNAPLRGRKGQFYEGGFRMPCIIRWPRVIPAGSVCSQLASTLDILPTVNEILHGDTTPDAACDGVSLMTILKDPETTSLERPGYAYYSGSTLSAVRAGKYKLHCRTGELFDLENDIGESQNVAPFYPALVEELSMLAEGFRADIGDGDRVGRGIRRAGRVDSPRPVVEWLSR